MKKNAAISLAAASAAALFCACGNLFSAGNDVTETQISVSPEAAALLSCSGIQAEGWTLLCYFASGAFMEKTSASGSFSVELSDSDVAAVFARPSISSPQGLDESAVPEIGGVYPFYCELGGSSVNPGARLELDFYGGVAARAAKYIFSADLGESGGGSAENIARLARAFNWSKLDNHLRTAERAAPYPLLVDMDKFVAAFLDGETSMYWNIRTAETHEAEIALPEEIRSGDAAKAVFPYFYPSHVLELESEGEGLPETIELALPDGQWFFLFPGSRTMWLAIQAKSGKISASYSSESLR